jgi:cytochrome c biogenesis protein CcmG/thiol:disulfide interchange protein DsbE
VAGEKQFINYKVVIVLVILVGGIFLLHWNRAERYILPVPGNPAPRISFQDLKGRLRNLDDLKGKTVLVHIWATWCTPCLEELPSLESLYREYRDKGLTIMAVSIDKKADTVRRFVKGLGLTFPVLLDPEGKVTHLYRTTGVPETFIVDKKGIIREKIIGAGDWSHPSRRESLARLIKE